MINQLLVKAGELFFKYGIRSVSMDDIARELGISKKTLYLTVENKADLVHKSMVEWLKIDKEACNSIIDVKKNAIDELIEIGQHVREFLKGLNPSLMYDLQKYYPEVWKLNDLYKWDFIAPVIRANMLKGIEQGMFRDDLNVEMIARLYLVKTTSMLNNKTFPVDRFPLTDLYVEFLKYHIRGIASPKGNKRLDKILSKHKKTQI